MTRKPMTLAQWSEEVSFVRSIDRVMTETGDPGENFNHDPACFDRYCRMQARFCNADGYPELAYLIHSDAF